MRDAFRTGVHHAPLGAGETHQHEAGVLGQRERERGRAPPRPRRRRPRTRRPSAPARSRSGRSAPARAAPATGRGSVSRSPCRPRCAARRPRVRRPGCRPPRTARPRAAHPSCRNRAAARPAGRAATGSVARSRLTGSKPAAFASTSCTVSVPHTPHAELTSRAVGIASGGAERSTVTTLNSSSGVRVTSVQYFTPAIASGVVTRSCTSQPAASSKSFPGVRIVTATRWAGEWGAATRISSGSSVATRSSWSSRVASRNSATRVRTDGPGRRALVVLTRPTVGRGWATSTGLPWAVCRNRLVLDCVPSP